VLFVNLRLSARKHRATGAEPGSEVINLLTPQDAARQISLRPVSKARLIRGITKIVGHEMARCQYEEVDYL